MINVSKLKEGIVIDHIRAGHGYKIFQQLGLDTLEDVVVLMLGGRYFSMTEMQAEAVTAFGCAMAYVEEAEDGRLVTIPINEAGPEAEF